MALQNFKATVIKKESLTDSVILLSFSVPDFSFKAGQFVTLKIEQFYF